MNKEELTTLLVQGTSHCSCLEHCFLFCVFCGRQTIRQQGLEAILPRFSPEFSKQRGLAGASEGFGRIASLLFWRGFNAVKKLTCVTCILWFLGSLFLPRGGGFWKKDEKDREFLFVWLFFNSVIRECFNYVRPNLPTNIDLNLSFFLPNQQSLVSFVCEWWKTADRAAG